MPRFLSRALRLAIFAGALGYLVSQVHWAALVRSVAHYDPGAIALALALSWAAYFALAVRLNAMLRERPGVRPCFGAELVALGLNNLLPAKLGEMAKVLYLDRRARIGVSRLVGVVFWERFLDANTVLLMALAAVVLIDARIVVLAPFAALAAVWMALLPLLRWPGGVARLLRRLPWRWLRDPAERLAVHLRSGLSGAERPVVVLATAAVWFGYAGAGMVLMLFAGHLPITAAQALVAFLVGAIGMAVPSAPGGLGVFEASLVAALGWFGVGADQALALALVTRAVDYLPTTAAAAWLLGRGNFFGTLRGALRPGAAGGGEALPSRVTNIARNPGQGPCR